MAAATRARPGSKPYTPAPTKLRQSQRLVNGLGHHLTPAPPGTPQIEVIKLQEVINRILREIPQDPELKTWALRNICDTLHAALENRPESDSPIPQKRKRLEFQAPISDNDHPAKKRARDLQDSGDVSPSNMTSAGSPIAPPAVEDSRSELSDSESVMAHGESQGVRDAEPEVGEEDHQSEHDFDLDDNPVGDDMDIQLQLDQLNSDPVQSEEQSQQGDVIAEDDTRSTADAEEMEVQEVDPDEEESQQGDVIAEDDPRSNADAEEMEGQEVDPEEEESQQGDVTAEEDARSNADAEEMEGQEVDPEEEESQQGDVTAEEDTRSNADAEEMEGQEVDPEEEESQQGDVTAEEDARSNADAEEMEVQEVDPDEEEFQQGDAIAADDPRSNADAEEMEVQEVDPDEEESQQGDAIAADDPRSNADAEETEVQEVDPDEEESQQGDDTPMGEDEATELVHMPSAEGGSHPHEDADGLEVDDTSMGGIDTLDEPNDIPLPAQGSQNSRPPCLEASPPHTPGLLSSGPRRFTISPSTNTDNQKLDTLASAAASLSKTRSGRVIRRDGEGVSTTHTPTTNLPLPGLNGRDMDMREQHQKYQQNTHATAVAAARALAEERDALHRRHPVAFSKLWNELFPEEECHKLPVVQSRDPDDQVELIEYQEEVQTFMRKWSASCNDNSAALCEAIQLHNARVQTIEGGARLGIINPKNTVVADAALVEDGSGQRPVPPGANQQTRDSSSSSPTHGNAHSFMAEDGVNAAPKSSAGETVDAAGNGASSAEGSRHGSPVNDLSTDLEKIKFSTPARANRPINGRGVSPFSDKIKFIMPGTHMREITIDRVNNLFDTVNGLSYKEATKSGRERHIGFDAAKKIIGFFTEKTFTDSSIERVKAVLRAYTSGEFRDYVPPLLTQGHAIDSSFRTEKMKALDASLREEIALHPFQQDPDGDITDLAFRKQCYDTYRLHFTSLKSLKSWRELEADMTANRDAYPRFKKVGVSFHNELLLYKATELCITPRQLGKRIYEWKVLEMLVCHFGTGILLFADRAVYTRLAKHLPRNAAEEVLRTISESMPELRLACTRLERDVMCYLVDTYDTAQGVPHINYLAGNEVVFDGSNAGSASPSPTPFAMEDRDRV